MLFMFGAVPFNAAPLSLTDASSDGDFDFAEHKVLGAAPIYENMGEGDRQRKIKGATFPYTQSFEDGLTLLDRLEVMRRNGEPQHLFRGDGRPLGWFVITKLSEAHKDLGFNGVGSQVSFDISLTQTDSPGIGGLDAIIGGFFS